MSVDLSQAAATAVDKVEFPTPPPVPPPRRTSSSLALQLQQPVSSGTGCEAAVVMRRHETHPAASAVDDVGTTQPSTSSTRRPATTLTRIRTMDDNLLMACEREIDGGISQTGVDGGGGIICSNNAISPRAVSLYRCARFIDFIFFSPGLQQQKPPVL